MDWSKVSDPLKEQLLELFLDRLKAMGADVAAAGPKATEAASLGAKALVRKFSGDVTADADLVVIEGILWGIAANFIAKETDKQAWMEFAMSVLTSLVKVLPVILPLLLAV